MKLWQAARAIVVVAAAAFSACDLVLPLVEDAGPLPGTTFACGPTLTCSLGNPTVGCCVVLGAFDARAPLSYGYECVSGAQCAKDNDDDAASRVEIHCDNGSQCPGDAEACCWPSTAAPVTTYCFQSTASNCATELCDPDAEAPCINVKHTGYVCVPASSVLSLQQAPLGYHVCVPPDAG